MKIKTIRHSLSHILASAIQELYPKTKFGMGPAIENGFYYDFELPKPLTTEDLPLIEKKMREMIKKKITFKKRLISKNEAKKIFKGQTYKLELAKEAKEKNLTVYESQNFIDLCKGPHAKSTKEINPDSFKLTKVAGAYWKGSEKNPMLTRVYGVAFKNKKELAEYLLKEAEAEKRDHRVLGKKLELFLIDENIGAGLPLWLPKGAIIRKIIENYLYQELSKEGYEWLYTPHIGSRKLWETSGHWDFYNESMYPPLEVSQSLEDVQKGRKPDFKEEYLLKPMNCPFHLTAYNSKIRSYRELPIKLAELGTVYRYERSGTLHGLTRARGFTQDDAHLICTPQQAEKEVEKLVKQAFHILNSFGFKEFNIYLSTKPEKYIGSLKNWKKATNTLKYALKKLNLKYQVDRGGGVFYGPKIDFKIKDSIGREWQCTTIQFDFNIPEKFNIFYINERGKKKEPFIIHRAILGSIERFIGVLTEHYAGAFPFWLSPEQVWIIPIGSRHEKYGDFVNKKLKTLQAITGNLRVKLKNENETVSKKIREGEMQKIPYLLVVGDKEMKSKSVRIRQRGRGDIGEMKLAKFLENIKIEVDKKKQ